MPEITGRPFVWFFHPSAHIAGLPDDVVVKRVASQFTGDQGPAPISRPLSSGANCDSLAVPCFASQLRFSA
jgi:hypothetical protein